MNTISKTVFAVALALNIAAVAAVTGVALKQHAIGQTETIQLGTVVVTPADAENLQANLGTIVVTPSEDDWRFAEARGVQRPVAASIALGTIVVKPTVGQLAELADAMPKYPAPAAVKDKAEAVAGVSLIEALESISPSRTLLNASTLRVLDSLVFGHFGG
ncbi:MAG: hypothetical protein KGL13_02150 [Gammaproteobacteria bacterium]|nr:hypothetical protein [Gammaproteobacteria bacterium]MDE2345248.1 hypothetical protein [Gammaproteobacteria bacterium]